MISQVVAGIKTGFWDAELKLVSSEVGYILYCHSLGRERSFTFLPTNCLYFTRAPAMHVDCIGLCKENTWERLGDIETGTFASSYILNGIIDFKSALIASARNILYSFHTNCLQGFIILSVLSNRTTLEGLHQAFIWTGNQDYKMHRLQCYSHGSVSY